MDRFTYVLDTSAILRFPDKEAGYARVAEILIGARQDEGRALISAGNWGELIAKLHQRLDAASARHICDRLSRNGLEVVPATLERATASGHIKASLGITLGDCCGVEVTQDSLNHVLVSADFDVKSADQLANIEFLPSKPKP